MAVSLLAFGIHTAGAANDSQAASELLSDVEKVAKAGGVEAQVLLARHFLFGPEGARNPTQAMYWASQAAADHPPGQYLVGLMLMTDKRDHARLQQGFAHLARSAKGGCAGAAGVLGNMFLVASAKDPKISPMATELIRGAARGGDYMSQTLLAKLYQEGNAVIKRDTVTTYAWLLFAMGEQPDNKLTRFSLVIHERLEAVLSDAEMVRAQALAGDLKSKHGKETYGFCSQSAPDVVVSLR